MRLFPKKNLTTIMTKQRPFIISSVILLILAASVSLTGAEIGEPAPEFTLKCSNGKEHSLSDYEGKFVVLEWVNHGCPFVRKFYEPGEMQRLQKECTDEGVIWLTMNSSAPGKQGHMTAEEANRSIQEKDAHPTAILLDHDGAVGKKFDARVTPHMYVIDREGVLIYNGAIDSNPSSRSSDIEAAENYVVSALTAAMNGDEVETPRTRPYGCGMKYKD